MPRRSILAQAPIECGEISVMAETFEVPRNRDGWGVVTSVFIGPVIRALAHDQRSSLRVVPSDPRSEVGFHRILQAAQLFAVARQSAGLTANTVLSMGGVFGAGGCFLQPD